MTAPWTQQVELADLLTSKELLTTSQVPEKVTPPFRYVLTSDPWIASGPTLGSWRVRFRVVCVTAPGSNEKQMTDLSDMVRAVVRALKGSRFKVDGDAVDEPAVMATGSGASLGAAVNVSTVISRAEFEEEPAP